MGNLKVVGLLVVALFLGYLTAELAFGDLIVVANARVVEVRVEKSNDGAYDYSVEYDRKVDIEFAKQLEPFAWMLQLNGIAAYSPGKPKVDGKKTSYSVAPAVAVTANGELLTFDLPSVPFQKIIGVEYDSAKYAGIFDVVFFSEEVAAKDLARVQKAVTLLAAQRYPTRGVEWLNVEISTPEPNRPRIKRYMFTFKTERPKVTDSAE